MPGPHWPTQPCRHRGKSDHFTCARRLARATVLGCLGVVDLLCLASMPGALVRHLPPVGPPLAILSHRCGAISSPRPFGLVAVNPDPWTFRPFGVPIFVLRPEEPNGYWLTSTRPKVYLRTLTGFNIRPLWGAPLFRHGRATVLCRSDDATTHTPSLNVDRWPHKRTSFRPPNGWGGGWQEPPNLGIRWVERN